MEHLPQSTSPAPVIIHAPGASATMTAKTKSPLPSAFPGKARLLRNAFFNSTTKQHTSLDEIKNLLKKYIKPADFSRYCLLVEKINEGPTIAFASDEELMKIINAKGAALFAGDSGKDFRRINRIAGQMQDKLERLNSDKADFFQPLLPKISHIHQGIQFMIESKNLSTSQKITPLMIKLLEEVKVLLNGPKGSRFIWPLYDLLGHFGPFVHACHNLALATKQDNTIVGEIESQKNTINSLLRDIRQLMAKNPDGITVVAHRGNGPTNRTMGALIVNDDNRRKYRMAENSPESFKQALEFAVASEDPAMLLDGVECDVFLSKDGIPMLSHEGNVLEQLNDAQKREQAGQVGKHDEVRDFSSTELKSIKRNDREGSSFMSLEDLFQMVEPAAARYYEITGKAFRIEVEMKGNKSHGGRTSPLKDKVAKVVSQFYKKSTQSSIEVILFNGVENDIQAYSDLRSQKSALGSIYTGFNRKEDVTVDTHKYIDELRYQFNDEFRNARKTEISKANLNIANSYLENFIVTLVFGQEFQETYSDVEPSHSLERYGGQPLNDHADKLRDTDMQIQKALEKYVSDPNNFEKAKKLHVLTDYPQKAGWMKVKLKDALVNAKQKASAKVSEEKK